MPVRVLLVEDDELFAALVREMLAQAAPEVELEHANRLSSALARIFRQDFAVIVTDLNLPDSDGPSTVRHLLRAAPDVPVVVLSGNSEIGTALDAIHEGADDFMVKGALDADAVAHLVRVAAERSRRVRVEPVTSLAALAAVGDHLIPLVDRLGLALGVVSLRVESANSWLPGVRRGLLEQVTVVLRQVLRRADFVSRADEGELMLTLVTHDPELHPVLARIRQALVTAGLHQNVRMGAVLHDAGDPTTFTELIGLARQAAPSSPGPPDTDIRDP
jgi:CheY-like chemotaxis protein